MGKLVTRELFTLLKNFGVQHVIGSPGSRNAALLAEIDSMDDLTSHVVVDERSAGFIALGLALGSRTPVALICTSGSAVLNYAPAISEAYYQGIPLIVISADRPYEWIDQDDSQTIRQHGVLSNFVKKSYDILGDCKDPEYLWYVNRIVNEGMLESLNPKMGPVHFNIHLNGETDEIRRDRIHTARTVEILKPKQLIDTTIIDTLAEEATGKKIMLVAGFHLPDNNLQKAVLSLLSLPNVCIMAETVSNLHLPNSCYQVDIPLFRLSDKEKRILAPDILISMGGALISRQLKEFIRNNPPRAHWSLSYSDVLVDCFKSLTVKIESEPSSFIKAFSSRLARRQEGWESTYGTQWEEIRSRLTPGIARYPWCDLKALSMLLNSLPEDANLFLSNGTSVRYGQVIPYDVTHATYSNRGVSGIEGCTSTSVGLAMAYPSLTCLITGDMSFGYDLAGLVSGSENNRLRIVVLDNNGGDIFRFIPSTRNLSIREQYLSVGRELPVGLLADAFGFIYYYADTEKKLREYIGEFFSNSPRPAILHIDTREADNSSILTEYLTGKNNRKK